MENKANYPEYTFLHAKARMEELFPIHMSEDSFIEKAYITWRSLPDRHSYYHVYIGTVDLNNKIEIPDNVEHIVAVTFPMYINNFFMTNNYFIFSGGSYYYPFYNKTKEWESYRVDKSLSERYGYNITYNLEGKNLISFPQANFEGEEIAILYKGLLVNEDCDPLLYNNEVNAIAYNVALMDTRFEAFNNVPGKLQLLQYIESKADLYLAKAGIAEKLTDNELDSILNVATSFDRKVYNKNYKFRK